MIEHMRMYVTVGRRNGMDRHITYVCYSGRARLDMGVKHSIAYILLMEQAGDIETTYYVYVQVERTN
jgi:hypothetical protein